MPLVLTVLLGCSNWINKTMQAVAVEPAVALEALPPATFDCIGLHHKEEQRGEIPKKRIFINYIQGGAGRRIGGKIYFIELTR